MSVVWTMILLTAAAGVGGTGLGGAIACLFRKDSGAAVSLLLSYAAGVMTSVVCFDLLATAIAPEDGGAQIGIFWVILGVLAGCAVIAGLNACIARIGERRACPLRPGRRESCARRWMGRAGRAQAHSPAGMNSSLFAAGLVMAAAIALHNVPEGVVIGASFARPAAELLSRSGLMMAAVIGLHNIPEGMAVAVPLISGGMSRPRAAAMTAVTGLPTLLGAIVGFYLGAMGPLALAMALSFASGAMLYVVFGELLPEANLLWRSRLPALAALLGMMTGLVVIYA